MGRSGSAQAVGEFSEMLDILGFKHKRVPNDHRTISAEQWTQMSNYNTLN